MTKQKLLARIRGGGNNGVVKVIFQKRTPAKRINFNDDVCRSHRKTKMR